MMIRRDLSEISDSAARKSGAKDDERVLVAPTRLFRALGDFQGFSAEAVDEADAIFASDQLFFMRRGDAERDEEHKQLIPYALFTYVDAKNVVYVFAYLRGKGQGESRLHSKWSVGIGGHVNESDRRDDGVGLFDAGVRREIEEEVAIDANVLSFRKAGLVNDDSTAVGRAHLGVVCVAELDAPRLRSNEPDLLEAGFRPVEELLREIEADPTKFESWTTLALRGLFGDGKQSHSKGTR